MRSFSLLSLTLVAACSMPVDPSAATKATAANAAVPAGKWYWTGSDAAGARTSVSKPARYSLEFVADGSVLVQADCNQGRSSYRIANGVLTIDPPGMTKIGCGEASQDREFLRQISQPGAWAAAGATAMIRGSAATMHLAREPK